MTSDLLKEEKSDLNVNYRITGKDKLSLPVGCSFCVSIKDADQHAINEAMKFARNFPCIILHKKVVGQKEEIIYRSRASKKERARARAAKFFQTKPILNFSLQY